MNTKRNPDLIPYARELRKNMTPEEKHLWYDFLHTYSVKFVRQKVLGYYIADFYCAKANLVIELDGSQHFYAAEIEKDTKRTQYLEQFGLKVIRIPNTWLGKKYFKATCELIDACVQARLEGKELPVYSIEA